MKRALTFLAFLLFLPLTAYAQMGVAEFITPYVKPIAGPVPGQVYPAPSPVGLAANRPTFCSATGQFYYATDTSSLYDSTVAGTSCTWTLVGGSAASPVASVFARTGAVVAASGDYTCPQVTNCNVLPSGTDSGSGSNAYVVNPSPAVTASFGQSFTFTTTHASTGAATMNASGTGVKNLRTIRNTAFTGTEISNTGTVTYQVTYDGTEWLLAGTLVAGNPANPGGTLNLAGAYVIGQPSTNIQTSAGLTLMGPPANSSGPNSRQMLTFLCVPLSGGGCGGTQNTNASMGFDNDNNFLISGNYGDVAILNALEVFGESSAQNQGKGTNLLIWQQANPNANTCQLEIATPLVGTMQVCFDGVTALLTANPQKVFVTSDVTDSTDATLVPITGLTYTMPLGTINASFHCSLMFEQASAAVADAFGIGVTLTAPTQVNANGVSFSGTASAPTAGTLIGLTTTTPTAIVTFTPSAITTVWNATLDGTIEYPGNATQAVVNFYMSTTTGADNLIVKRGSYCSLF